MNENEVEMVVGGVLSDGAIQEEVDADRLIVEGFQADSLRPASYDLTVACDGLIDPDEKEIEPGGKRRQKRVILQPGDAAMFSTHEKFCMPKAVAGNISIKNRPATEGLMLLSGGLIDPCFGYDEKLAKQTGARLYLHVANIGRETIEIRPGIERIARVQFLRVCGGELARDPIDAAEWKDQKKLSLGFLSELKELKDSSEGNRDLIRYVVVGVAFVLLMTMLSVSLAVILSLSSDSKLAAAAKAAVPQSTSGKWLWAALVFAVSVLAFGSVVALLLQAKRDRRRRR